MLCAESRERARERRRDIALIAAEAEQELRSKALPAA